MDHKELYEPLTKKLKAALPQKAMPIREMVQVFREKEVNITLKTEIIIVDVFNSGDISGIICTLEIANKKGHACALSHLMFSPASPLFKEIVDYQRKRAKRVEQLNKFRIK